VKGVWLAVALAGTAWAGEPPKTSADDVSRDAEKTAHAAAKYANEKKDEFEKRVGTRLDDGRKRLEEISRQAAGDRARAQKNLDQLLADAEAKGNEAQKRMDELKRSTGEAWRDLKKGTETAVEDFSRGVDKAKR
jgi:hypothetical protein